MYFILLLIVLTVIALLYLFLTWNFNHWTKQGVPGPKPTILVGSFPGEFRQKENIAYEIDRIYRKYREITPFIGVFSTRRPQLIVCDPKMIKHIKITEFKNFNGSEFSNLIDKETDKILSKHPFCLTDDEWKEKRAEIAPAFTSLRIKSMYPIMQNVGQKFTAYIKSQIKTGKPFDAKDLASKFTLDVVASCIFGIDSQVFTNDNCELHNKASQILAPSTKVLIYFTALSILPSIKKIWKVPVCDKSVENYFIQLCDDAIKMRQTSKIERNDYLNYVMELKRNKNISDIDVAAHTITFLADGYETSSLVIANVFYALAGNVDVQMKLRKEIEQFIEKYGDITFEHLQEMQYLDQVVNETLRLYPPGSQTTRRCTRSTTLYDYKDKPIKIDKDIIVIIPLLSIHLDPKYYSDPLEFYPERFSPENGGIKKYKDMGVFLAFGDGPRICLGMKFAMIEIKAAIVEIIKNFDISLNSKTHAKYVYQPTDTSLQPIGGIWIDLKEITK